MSSVVSSVLVLLLFVALAAPAALGGVGGVGGRAVTAFYTLLLMGVLAPYASLPASRVTDAPLIAGPSGQSIENNTCEQALAAAQRNGIVLDRAVPGRLVVNQEYWKMIPENVRQALTECTSQLGGSDGGGAAVEIVERAG